MKLQFRQMKFQFRQMKFQIRQMKFQIRQMKLQIRQKKKNLEKNENYQLYMDIEHFNRKNRINKSTQYNLTHETNIIQLTLHT